MLELGLFWICLPFSPCLDLCGVGRGHIRTQTCGRYSCNRKALCRCSVTCDLEKGIKQARKGGSIKIDEPRQKLHATAVFRGFLDFRELSSVSRDCWRLRLGLWADSSSLLPKSRERVSARYVWMSGLSGLVKWAEEGADMLSEPMGG